jgi:hypothetical protein
MRARANHNIFLVVGLAVAILSIIAASGGTQANATTAAVTALIPTIGSDASTPTPTEGTGSMPTPTPGPSPAPDISPEAQTALQYVARRESIPITSLTVVNDFQRDAPLLSRHFQAVTLVDQQSGRFFELLVDRNHGQVEERGPVEAAEGRARYAKYGKLQPDLYTRLQQLQDTDLVTVTIVVVDAPGQSQSSREQAAYAALAAKYPESRAAIANNKQPMDVDDPVLAEQIYKEYVTLLKTGVSQSKQALVAALQTQGFIVHTSEGLPAVTVSIPKRIVMMVARRGDVGTIFLSELRSQPSISSSVKTNRAPAVWARGFDGSNVKIAFVDATNVDMDNNGAGGLCLSGTNNCFLHPGLSRPAFNNCCSQFPDHATLSASAAASNQVTYRGMAYGATIMSAGVSGNTEQEQVDGLVWALDNGALIVNSSWGTCGTTYQTGLDRAYDSYARERRKLLVVGAGNRTSSCPNYNVWSPGNGWNVLTVGGSADQNDPNSSNDVIWNDSGTGTTYINPTTSNNDLEKPEVVAPAKDITGVGINGVEKTNSGTSFAAPRFPAKRHC